MTAPWVTIRWPGETAHQQAKRQQRTNYDNRSPYTGDNELDRVIYAFIHDLDQGT